MVKVVDWPRPRTTVKNRSLVGLLQGFCHAGPVSIFEDCSTVDAIFDKFRLGG